MLVRQRERFGMLRGAVRTAVVDKHDLDHAIGQYQLLTNGLIEQVDRLLLVEHRDDQRDFHASGSRKTRNLEKRKPQTRLMAENTIRVSSPGNRQWSAP
ncbi:hypothetical protein D3C72_2249490 [compost metagenome]